MFIQILQVISILAIFLPVRWLCWKITEDWGVPEMIDYRPWNCKLCLTFWSLIAIYLTVGLILQAYITMIGGIILAILNAIAMYINQRNKTIKI